MQVETKAVTLIDPFHVFKWNLFRSKNILALNCPRCIVGTQNIWQSCWGNKMRKIFSFGL